MPPKDTLCQLQNEKSELTKVSKFRKIPGELAPTIGGLTSLLNGSREVFDAITTLNSQIKGFVRSIE